MQAAAQASPFTTGINQTQAPPQIHPTMTQIRPMQTQPQTNTFVAGSHPRIGSQTGYPYTGITQHPQSYPVHVVYPPQVFQRPQAPHRRQQGRMDTLLQQKGPNQINEGSNKNTPKFNVGLPKPRQALIMIDCLSSYSKINFPIHTIQGEVIFQKIRNTQFWTRNFALVLNILLLISCVFINWHISQSFSLKTCCPNYQKSYFNQI